MTLNESSMKRTLPSRVAWCKDLIECSNTKKDLMVGHTTRHRHIAVEKKQKLRVHAMKRHHLANGTTMDINWTPSMSMNTVASGHGQSANKTINKNVGTDVESDLTMSNSQKVKLELLWGKSDHEPNIRVVEHFLIFPTVICTPWYGQWFRRYDVSKLIRLLKFCYEHNWAFWKIWMFDPH
jgi:hypothetical protein